MTTPVIYDSRNVQTLAILNNTISVVNTVKSIIPFGTAQGVLSSITDILTLVRDSIQNRDDFIDVVQQCRRIAGILENAQSGSHFLDDTVTKAISSLQQSVTSVQESVDAKTKDSHGKRLFKVVVDRENIAGWQKKLDSSLQFFIAEMALATNNALAIKNMADTLKVGEVVPDALPSPPAVFFGRTELMDQVTLALLKGEHVALVGGGGMGKSSIAATVLQSSPISERFKDRRFFVRFDDINPAQITLGTFLGRVSRALGIKSTQVEPHTLISRYLSSSETLVVLDNGESFQDSQSGDPEGRIASVVIDFSSIPGVAILLTTRTATIPFVCHRINVPNLEEQNACDAFMKIYPNFSGPKILPKLLSTLDFHPLSINLLARTAAQNNYTPDDLLAAWENQKVRLLEQGGGKFQSLAATIGLSLKSPSISILGDAALRLLQTIALLPQGLYEKHMKDIIPRVPIATLEKAVAVLSSHSLIFREGGFINMLAPIRLHIAGPDNDGIFSMANNVLVNLHACYFRRLKRVNKEDIDWLKVEDMNTENLLANALAKSTDKTMGKLCFDLVMPFLQFLQAQKPRATTLRAAILDLPEMPDREGFFLKVFWQNFRDGMNLVAKRTAIIFLANLAAGAGQMEEARELASIARSILQKHDLQNAPMEGRYIRICEEVISRSDFGLGRYNDAEATLKAALSAPLSFRLKGDVLTDLNIANLLLCILLARGKDEEIPDLIAKIKKDLKRMGRITAAEPQNVGFWSLQLALDRKGEFDDAKKFCEDIIHSKDTRYSEDCRVVVHLMSIEIALRQNDEKQAKANLERARKSVTLTKARHLSILAAFTARIAKDLSEARSLVNRAIADASTLGIILLSISSLYVAAGIEMQAGDYTTARDLYNKIIEDGGLVSELPYRTRAMRALGEIALLEGDENMAHEKFEEAKSLCKVMGIPPKNLYRDALYVRLEDGFSGWDRFLEASARAT